MQLVSDNGMENTVRTLAPEIKHSIPRKKAPDSPQKNASFQPKRRPANWPYYHTVVDFVWGGIFQVFFFFGCKSSYFSTPLSLSAPTPRKEDSRLRRRLVRRGLSMLRGLERVPGRVVQVMGSLPSLPLPPLPLNPNP